MQHKHYFSEPIIHKITIMNFSVTDSQGTLNFHSEVKQKPALHQAGIFLTCMLVVANNCLILGSEFRTGCKPQRTKELCCSQQQKESSTLLAMDRTKGVSHSHHSHIMTKQSYSAFRALARIVTMADIDSAWYFPQKYLAK